MPLVILIVFDGLQPSQITMELMPNLFEFKNLGTNFTNNHPVFPSVTRANAATMVTGMNPGNHGLTANTLVVPEFMPNQVIPALEEVLQRISDTTGKVLLAPTLADILGSQNKKYIAVGTGTSGNAYIHNPKGILSGGETIHPDFTLPRDLYKTLNSSFGEWPAEEHPNTKRISHAFKLMTDYILEQAQPNVALLWSSEPDKSQHYAGVGSALSNRSLLEIDHQFGLFIQWLEDSGQHYDTDVIVLSDHGYSTISETIKIEELVRQAGFPTGERPNGVAIANNGGAALFYVHNHNAVVTNDLAHWLMEQPWCGSLTSSQNTGEISGTIPNSIVGLEGPRAPDLALSFKWSGTPNMHGYPSHVYSTSGSSGTGQHGSMSKQELSNVLLAKGPSFKSSCEINVPSGNVDIAQTVLHILGVRSDQQFDGRVLKESLTNGINPEDVQYETIIHSAEHSFHDKVYRQIIHTYKVDNTIYISQGNGALGRR
jgi:arylsulfatase A-like enzyme